MIESHGDSANPNQVVHCVMVAPRGVPYDLQYVGSTEAMARRFADEFCKVTAEVYGGEWILLSTGYHWFNPLTQKILRVAPVEVDVPRAQQPGDPPELKAEIEKILEGRL